MSGAWAPPFTRWQRNAFGLPAARHQLRVRCSCCLWAFDWVLFDRAWRHGPGCSFTAVTSIATIGLYISYVVPVFLRCTVARATFVRGPFHLGRLSLPIGITAVLWVVFVSCIFVLPTVYPGQYADEEIKKEENSSLLHVVFVR